MVTENVDLRTRKLPELKWDIIDKRDNSTISPNNPKCV